MQKRTIAQIFGNHPYRPAGNGFFVKLNGNFTTLCLFNQGIRKISRHPLDISNIIDVMVHIDIIQTNWYR